MKKRKFILSVFLLIGIYFMNAQKQKEKNTVAFVTDRPDQTESSVLVPKRFLQVETGVFYESLEVGNFNNKTSTLNTTLLRYGLLENLEFRIGFSFTEINREINDIKLNNISSGFSPLTLGVKIGITKGKGLFPEIAFLSHINFPFLASNDFKTKSTSIDFRFAFAHTLNEKSSLSYNLGMAWDGDITTANYVYTTAYGYTISNKVGVFIEIYGDLPEDSHFNHFWDTGLTYLISDNIQLDVSGGTGLSKNVQDLFLSAGISFRLPK